MIDLHAHILPSIDDGASSDSEALAMVRAAAADGIRMIAATPHHNNGIYTNTSGSIIEGVTRLNALIKQQDIPVTVIPGQEVRFNDRFWEEHRLGHVQSLNGSRYLLVELPSSIVPRNFADTVHELVVSGIVPVIAHPERNAEIAANPDKLKELVQLGAIGQLTTHSLCGLFGRKIRKLSLELIRQQLVHILASDAHDIARRTFNLSEAYEVLRKEAGQRHVGFFQRNAEIIMENGEIIIPRSIPIRKNRFLWW